MAGNWRHVGAAAGALATAMLVVGWIAVAQTGFDRVFLIPVTAASIAFVVAALGALARRSWVFGGGTIGTFVFCPSPFGFWPLLAGTVLVTLFAVAAHQALDKEENE